MMKELPLVSVYVPTCNRLALLKRAIRSVQEQLYDRWELVVVNDCSSDGTEEFLRTLSDPRIKVINNPVSMGACISRNLAIVAASGSFVTGLDDDDYFLPSRLTEFVSEWGRLAEANEVLAFLYDDMITLREEGEVVKRLDARAEIGILVGYNCVGSQVFCRRADIVEAGLFHPHLPAWQDWDMWVRLVRLGPGVNIGRATYVMDESHDFARISQKPEYVLRYAMRIFLQRNGPLTAAERACVAYNLGKYAQVRSSIADYLKMAPIILSRVLFWNKLKVRRYAR